MHQSKAINNSLNNHICFILPEYEIDSCTHYTYTYTLFNTYAKTIRSYLFLEKGEVKNKKNNFIKIVHQDITIKPFNLLERFFLLFKLRFKGTKIFFIHYSYWSLFLLKIISFVFPTKIYYWHAESLTKEDLKNMKYLERKQLILAIQLAPILVTAGNQLASDYSKTFSISKSKIKIIPNFLDGRYKVTKVGHLKRKLNIPKDDRVILFVHRLSKRKGAHLLPEIIKKIALFDNNIIFLIVGDGPLKKELMDKKYPIKVKFMGSIPQRDIFKYYALADIFIMPSQREGFPRVILEAMAAGLPIVTTNVGEVKQILPEIQNKYLIKKGDINNFSNAIIDILNSKVIYKKLSEENMKKVKQYGLTESLASLSKIIFI